MRSKRARERAGAGKGNPPVKEAVDLTTPNHPPFLGFDWGFPVEAGGERRPPLKLNLGAGKFKVPGWVNVDAVPELEPDLVDDIQTLERFEPCTVDAIYAGHVIEHLEQPIAALQRWNDLLKPGGELVVTCPNHAVAVELWMRAERFPILTEQPLTGLLAVTTGFFGFAQCQEARAKNPLAAQAQQHRRSLDLPVLMALMEATGFVELEQIDERECEAAPKFVEPVTWQMVVRGRKATNG